MPYESGFALVRDPARLGAAFGMPGAPYLPGPEDPRGGYGLSGRSRRGGRGRCRSGRRWPRTAATATGRWSSGTCDLAQRLAGLVDAAPDLERLADVPLNIVCFRVRPPGVPEHDLDAVVEESLTEVMGVGWRFYLRRFLPAALKHVSSGAFRPGAIPLAKRAYRATNLPTDVIV